MAPDFIQQVIEAGSNVELEVQYAPDFIKKWVALAVSKGVHLTVRGPYAPQFVIEWARIGGKNFTYKVPKL